MSSLVRTNILLFLLLLLPASGCQNNSSIPVARHDRNHSNAEPVMIAGNRYRAELTRKALRGLDYRSGKVVVDRDIATELVAGIEPEEADRLHKEGQAALSSGDAILSIELLTKCVILQPNRFDFHESLGVSLLAKKKTELAEAAFRSALDLNPRSAFSLEKLGLTLSGDRTRFPEAIQYYQQAADLNPENGHLYSRIAILEYYLGDHKSARQNVRLAEANNYSVPSQFKNLLTGNLKSPSMPLGRNGNNLPNIDAPKRVDINNDFPGNETTAASTDINPNCVIAGWNDYRNGSSANTGIGISNDGGENWTDFILRPPFENQNQTEGDPMTAYDNRTGNLWAGAISFGSDGGVFVARKNSEDTDFQPPVMAVITGSADKCWMAAGANPFDTNQTNLYVGYNQGLLVSTDEGDSWSGPIGFPEFGLGWLPRVGPNGELYLTYWDVNDGIKLLRSFDGGATLEGPITIATRMDVWFVDGSRFPGIFRCAPLATTAVDPNNGTIYVTWFDTTNIVNGNSNVDLYFSKSSDQGSTWSSPTIINTDAAIPGDQFFPWIEVDSAGRLHLLFYDSRSVSQDDNVFDDPAEPSCILETYYAYSDDQGDSWTEIVLTSQSFDTADAGFGGAFIGDYLGMGVSGTTVYPCYLTTNDGIANVFVNKITDGVVLGDLNGDGEVNLLDVQPFVDLIVNGKFDKAADINGDGQVDVLDISGFVKLLQG